MLEAERTFSRFVFLSSFFVLQLSFRPLAGFKECETLGLLSLFIWYSHESFRPLAGFKECGTLPWIGYGVLWIVLFPSPCGV